MKKFKVFFDWFFKIGTSILLVIFMLFSHFSILPTILAIQSEINKKENYEYQGILELWHIETFEGGSQNRGKFLEKVAQSFEKQHKGTYIVVLSMTLEQFCLNYNAGKSPNIISFGVGVGDDFADNLIKLDAENVRKDLLLGGKYNSKQLAVPYMLGGYAFISKDDLSNLNANITGVGLLSATNPLQSIKQNKLSIKLAENTNFDSYDAYDKFLKGYYENLLGTQRDVYRVSNRQQKGLLTDYKISALGGYSDLVQYASVFKKEKKETELSEKFVQYLISDEIQQKMKDISMFSTLNNAKLYESGIYQQMENVLNQRLETENAFESMEYITAKKEKLLNEYRKS